MKKRVLLIDDDHDDCIIFQTVIDNFDSSFDFSFNQHSHVALQLIQNSPEPIMDILFLDWNMPILSGNDFLKSIRELPIYANTPIVIYTTSNSDQDRKLAMKLGASSFITKPTSVSDLRQEILAVLFSYL